MAIKDPDKFAGEIFNVGLSSANVSKKELCERIKKFIPNFVFTESQLKSDPDQRNYIVSNKKLEKLGFRPEFSLDDGIMELIKGIPMLQLRPYTNL
jgi:nucleoside-diphosphate-sugar epimerase